MQLAAIKLSVCTLVCSIILLILSTCQCCTNYFYIGGVSISIPSDPPIAGESYTLECSAGGSEGTFQWLGPPNGRIPVVNSGSITISSNSTTSQLQFRPVQQSDNGSYSCSATTNGLTMSTESVVISVNGTKINACCYIHYNIFKKYFQLPMYQSRLIISYPLQQLEKTICSHVVYQELKISTLPLPTDGLRIIVLWLGQIQTPSSSLHFD